MTVDKEYCISNRLLWIDVLKGMGIIYVVIGHIFLNEVIFNWLYSFHMPLLFFVAGCVYHKKAVSMDLRRRIQTIVIPYFIFGGICLIYWLLVERRFRDSTMGLERTLIGLLLGQYEFLDFNVHLWFLPCFFLTTILFNILVNMGNRLTISSKLAYIASFVMSIVYMICPLPEMPWGGNRVFKYIGFYAIGCFFSEQKVETYIQRQSGITKGIEVITLIGTNFVLTSYILTAGVMWFITALIGVAGMTVLALSIRENRVFQYLGRISLVVLCMHGPVYRVVVKVISILLYMNTNTVRTNFALTMLVLAITMVICSIIYEIIVRIMPWVVGKTAK